MIKELTLELFLELPDKIIKVAREQNNYLDLLSSDLINEYYYTNLRKDLTHYFNNFNDSKFMFTFNNIDSINITPHYGENFISKNTQINDKISNFITNKLDKEIWSKDF